MFGSIVMSVMSEGFQCGIRQNLNEYERNFLSVLVNIIEVLCSPWC